MVYLVKKLLDKVKQCGIVAQHTTPKGVYGIYTGEES
jgi:hypothetical protein